MEIGGTIEAILAKKGHDVFTVPVSATVFDVITMFDEKNIGAVLIMNGTQLAGIVSERDYTRKMLKRGKPSRETAVTEIMSTNLTTVTSRETVDGCLRLMTDKRIRHLPVVENGELRGLLSIGDLVKYVIDTQSATIEHLESYISGGYR